MHCVGLHSIRREPERFRPSRAEGSIRFRSSWIVKAEGFGRHAHLPSCKRHRAVRALIASTRRLHPSSGDDIAKVKRASMTRTRSAKTYSSTVGVSSSTDSSPFSCRCISITGCSFLYLALTSYKRAFSCRRFMLR